MSPYKLKEVTSNGVVTDLTTEGNTGAAGSSRASYYFTMPNPPFLNILHTSFNRASEAIAPFALMSDMMLYIHLS